MVTRVPNRQRAPGHRDASTRITAELASIDFPATKEHLKDRVGDREIEVAEGEGMPLREMIDHIDRAEFASLTQLQAELDQRWQQYRAEVGAQDPPMSEYTAPHEHGRHGRKGHE